MSNRVPEGAFAFYVGLGSARSYELVATHFKVSKRAIVDLAAREGWVARLEVIEKEAKARTDARLVDDLEQMRMRHWKLAHAIAARAAKAMQEYPLTSAMEGVRAAELAIKLERLLAGEPTERSAQTVEEIIKHQYEKVMLADEEGPEADSNEARDPQPEGGERDA